MEENNKYIIPRPDNSGSSNTQKAGQNKSLVTIEAESQIGMGKVVSGLAAESNTGLNRQASVMAGAYLTNQVQKLEIAEREVKVLLPENAVLKAENKNLKSDRKRAALLNIVGVALMSLGTAALVGALFAGLNLSVVTAGLIAIFFGFLIQAVVIISSFSGSD